MDNLKFNFPLNIQSPRINSGDAPVYSIKVIGIGGAGCNAISAILNNSLSSLGSLSSLNDINDYTIHFISVNTDIQALSQSPIPNPVSSIQYPVSSIQLGPTLTKGLGTGGKPEIGRDSAQESADSIKSILSHNPQLKLGANSINFKILFILAGMGGGTGSGASPLIAQIAKELGFFVVSIITSPFDFEGPVRTAHAIDGTYALKRFSNALITIPNQKLLSLSLNPVSCTQYPVSSIQYPASSIQNPVSSIQFKDAFALTNDLIAHAVFGIINIITKPGIINLDLADVCSLLSEPGDSCISIARANGPSKASNAASQAINSPLLSQLSDARDRCGVSNSLMQETGVASQTAALLKKASGILLNITTSENFNLTELKNIFNSIHSIVDKNVNIIFGVALNNNLHDELILTLIATGIKDEKQKSIIKEKTLKTPAFKRRVGIHSLLPNDQLLPFYKN